MSSPPVKYLRYFDFTSFATLNPEKPLPGASVDQEFNRLKTTTDQTIDRLALIQRDDGSLNAVIGTAQLVDGSVTEPKLADLSVSTRTLQDGAVTSAKILDGSIALVDLSPALISAFSPAAHTHPESDVVNLIADLALKAPLLSPAFTGTPTAPTAATGSNTPQLATTAFVAASMSAAGLITEAPNDGKLYGRQALGWQRGVALAGDTMTGPLNAPAATFGDMSVSRPTNGPLASYIVNTDPGAAARSGWLAYNGVSYGGVLHYGPNYVPAGGDAAKPNGTLVEGAGAGGLNFEAGVAGAPMEWWFAGSKRMFMNGTTGLLTVPGGIAAPVTPNTNKIHNGDFRVNQRYQTGPMAPNGNSFGPDRWALLLTQPAKLQGQTINSPGLIGQNQSPLPGTFWRITPVNGAPVIGASDSFGFFHTVEGLDCTDTLWSALGGRPVTLSFWVESTIPGTYGGCLRNHGFFNRCYPFKFTITQASTWQNIVITIPPPAQGTNWYLDNNGCMSFVFCLGAGASNISTGVFAWENGAFHTPPGCINFMANQAASFDITGVKLELGSIATPFVVEPYGDALRKCQRYYHSDGGFIYHSVIMDGNSGEVPSMFTELPVTMRSTPSIVFNGISNIFYNNGSGEDFFVPAGGTPAFGGNYKSGLARIDNISNPKGAPHAGKCGMWLTNLAFSADI